MNPTASLFVLAALSATLPAQTHTGARAGSARRASTSSPARATGSRGTCAQLPELSPKIPALPAGAACARPLFTLTVRPAVDIDYVSPLEGSALADTLGLQSETFSVDYIDTKTGTGEVAQPHKWFSIQYTGYLVDGTKFDSSLDKPDHTPFTFQYGAHQVIAGWDTGFAGMRVGGKRRLFIPYQLAYGANGKPPIPGKAMLIFDVEFVRQSDQMPVPALPPAASEEPAPKTPAATKPTTPPATKPTSEPKPQ